MSSRARVFAVASAIALLAGACGKSDDNNASSSASASGGASTGGGGAGGTPNLVVKQYPDVATLQTMAVASSCASNQGVCHSSADYPELTGVGDLVASIGAPCQLGIQDPKSTLDACEVPGDRFSNGSDDLEILGVVVDDSAPFPPVKVTLVLSDAPKSQLDPTTANIRRLAAPGTTALTKSLAMTTMTEGINPRQIVLDVSADPDLAGWLDTRAWHGDRVRMGDPNGNGKAHDASTTWSEIVPGDPTRSFLYLRLIGTSYGPTMPILPGDWDAEATRAVWCWIRGLPKNATASSVKTHAKIDYQDCPPDPDAPDPNARGGWPAVQSLMGSRCAMGGCHDTTTKSAGLDLTPNASTFQGDVINKPSSQEPSFMRVVPGQPGASYLICKIDATCDSRAPMTARMPLTGTALSDDEIQTITSWILSGAPLE